ncbi:hypothetical protein ACIQH0_33365 [Streptomyces griseus]|uniref:hypothetical protein n=1 Tax=Streptomyces griseus TaxID=1911 RepID=UPI003803C3E5
MSPSQPTPASRPLAVGDNVHGFAHGAFGRDHHRCVRIEAVGPDWIVARAPDAITDHHGPAFTSGQSSLELAREARDEPCPEGSDCRLKQYRAPLTGYSPAEMAARQVVLHVVQVQPTDAAVIGQEVGRAVRRARGSGGLGGNA